MEWLTGPVGVALVGIIGIIVGGLLRLIPTKGSVENARIDQLQEDLAAERGERKDLSARVDAMDQKLTVYRRRDIAWMRHYAVIQRGVEEGNIPPWPDLPEVLRGDHE